jgi:hypothetical protein
MFRFFILSLMLVPIYSVSAQDDLLNELTKSEKPDKEPVLSTFSGTRVINGHSIETKHKGELEFIITHRFGRVNSGGYNMWGLDEAYIRLGLEYAITGKLGVGVGRSSFDKSFDYYVKYKILTQSNTMPVTITGIGAMAYNASYNMVYPELATQDKLAYVGQLLIARRFSDRLSLQISPSFVQRNTVDKLTEVNGLASVGFGGRGKVTKSMALVGEYYLRLNEKSNNINDDAIGFGIEFDTGGHIFQLVFTNSLGMMERSFMAETNGDFFDGDIHFGFNITRTFQLAGKK